MDKKFVMGIAAMAALTLVSCSSDDLDSFSDNSSKNEAISFDGYLGRSAVAVNGTRGSEVKIGDLQSEQSKGFGVFGYYNSSAAGHSDTESFDANLFNNQQVQYSSTDNKWTYTNTKYWPTEGHIDFLAYAPYDAGTFDNTYHLKFTVADQNQIGKQTDLLWTKLDGQTKERNSTVTLKFSHALSRLGYTVKLNKAYANATITLNKITLAGSNTEPTKNAFYKEGTIDLSTGKWSTLSSEDPKYNDAKQNFVWFNNETSGKTLSNEDDKVIKNSDSEYLFVIPQNFSNGNANNDQLYVIVDYTIKYTNYDNGAISEMKYTVSSKIEKNFEQGKAYTINLNIGLTPIEFNAEVTDWVTTENPINDIPVTWN